MLFNVSILPQGAEINATVRLTFSVTLLIISNQQCTNAFILKSVFHNGNPIAASILPQSAECNANINRISIVHNFAYDEQQCYYLLCILLHCTSTLRQYTVITCTVHIKAFVHCCISAKC